MAKINEYAQITNLSANDLFLIETASGTKSIAFRFIQQLLGSEDKNTTYDITYNNGTLTFRGSDGTNKTFDIGSGGGGTTLTQDQLMAIARAQTLTDTYIRNLFESGEGVSY